MVRVQSRLPSFSLKETSFQTTEKLVETLTRFQKAQSHLFTGGFFFGRARISPLFYAMSGVAVVHRPGDTDELLCWLLAPIGFTEGDGACVPGGKSMNWFLSDTKTHGVAITLVPSKRRDATMNTPSNSSSVHQGFVDTDPELGLYDIRIFWLAALAAIVAVLAVAYFKMGY